MKLAPYTMQRHRTMPMEASLVVAMTMQRYQLALVPGQTVKAHPKGTLRPRPGVWMMPHSTTGATRSDHRASGKSAVALGDPEGGVRHLTSACINIRPKWVFFVQSLLHQKSVLCTKILSEA